MPIEYSTDDGVTWSSVKPVDAIGYHERIIFSVAENRSSPTLKLHSAWTPCLEESCDNGRTWHAGEIDSELQAGELKAMSRWPDYFATMIAGIVAGVCAAATFFALLCYHNPFKLF
ncbi:hypothetical protein SH661x_000412 [Planctomicrobium sp. SH661]|uniref:hypothetical protein n=1 Tax=Planctomicrobium sp. SH661 TaxID=3448124 RepID=UPI003F5AE916